MVLSGIVQPRERVAQRQDDSKKADEHGNDPPFGLEADREVHFAAPTRSSLAGDHFV